MDGDQPNKTHEEGWFFHQLRGMLVLEIDEDLHLARGVPRAWLESGAGRSDAQVSGGDLS